MKFINILGIDNTNILSDFLNEKKLLENDLNLEKEMSLDELMKFLQLEKQVFIYKQNYSVCFKEVNINNERVLFYTMDKNFPEEGEKLFNSLAENFNINNYSKQNIFKPENDLLERDYYFIINNDFYY